MEKIMKWEEIFPFLQKIDAGYQLSETEKLELSQIIGIYGPLPNHVTVLPKAIKWLYNLERLSINSASIVEIDVLSNLTNLQVLNLNGTAVVDISALSNLTNLRELDLGFTPVVKISDLANLINLQKLDLSDSSVEEIDGLATLIDLRELNLSCTSVANLDALTNLINLRELDLSLTRITNIDSLSNLINLQKLDLRFTSITDIGALSGLIGLRTLDLGRTKITDISNLAELINLQELDISSTLVKEIEVLSNFTYLSELYLRETPLKDIKALGCLTNLIMLDLAETEINNIDVLKDLINLHTLRLNDTAIVNIDALSNLRQLQTLDLSTTSIVDLDAISNLWELRELDLSFTWITTVEELSDLRMLESLNLSYTSFMKTEELANLVNLRNLDLECTKIKNIDGLCNMINLQSLCLTKTPVTSLEGIAKLVNLQQLYLDYIDFTDLEELSYLINLEFLSMQNTPITSISSLSTLTRLIGLNIQNTNVSDIEALRGMVELKELDLSETQITTLPCWIGGMKNLRNLYVSRLHMHSIPKELLELNLPFRITKKQGGSNGIWLINTIFATQPISLFEQPRELIQAYYDAEQVPINEAKVIFLGDGGAGKTHTIKRIHSNGEDKKYETETTPGIDITNYKAYYNGCNFDIHFWDFGGQEIMHAMHRCFLTDRTCYVVVVSNRWDLNSRARYWLKNIDSFAKGAPVILAINRWDNIEERGIDMNRLIKDYPNLVKQPIYYSAKNSSESEFKLLIEAIMREAGKLDSAAMSFPAQWAAIRQKLLTTAEDRYYIDKDEYHSICEQYGLESFQIRTWLLEWFNDLGVCFSYHQNESEKTELASYKVLNPRWLTNAIYIIINAGRRYANKGQLGLNLIQDLLKHSELGVLSGVTYSESERDYVLDVMRKFNLSYSVSDVLEFIPALCDSETPEGLYPADYKKQVAYQMKYSYLPDSVVHQLMIRSYRNLNPEKVWRKGLRLDIEWLGLTAVVDMGNDDSSLRIDVFSNGVIEPWKMLHNIRKDIAEINDNLGLKAEDYIIIHEDEGDIFVTVNQLLAAKEQGMNTLQLYNEHTGKWKVYSTDNILGLAFGEEVIVATIKKVQEDNTTFSEAFSTINIGTINYYEQSTKTMELKLLEVLIQQNYETNRNLLNCLVNALVQTGNKDAETLAEDMKQDHKEKKNYLKRLEECIKPVSTIITGGKNIYNCGESAINAIQNAYPKIVEMFPQIADIIQKM